MPERGDPAWAPQAPGWGVGLDGVFRMNLHPAVCHWGSRLPAGAWAGKPTYVCLLLFSLLRFYPGRNPRPEMRLVNCSRRTADLKVRHSVSVMNHNNEKDDE